MASFKNLLTELTGSYYERNPRHATYNFGQDSQALYRNQPRLPFEYYININLNNVGTAGAFISKFFNSPEWTQLAPLVKSVDMPSMKIETTPLNQYNRKRLSQTKIAFEPVKIVFHDVADGKTLKFWDMYYRYYFSDGNEPGQNQAKQSQQNNGTYSIESLVKNLTPKLNSAISSLPTSIVNLFQSNAPTNANLPTNTLGDKSSIQNIVSDTLDNQNFGFNLPTVLNIRNLIQSIDIYQVHGGRFNQVTLVNPRVAAFTHDSLNYAVGDKTLELTFTFEYEYAYYTIQNMKLGGGEINNNSSLEQFQHGDFLELPSLAFNATLMDFVQINNPLLNSDNPILQGIGKNIQSSIGSVTGSFLSSGTANSLISGSALLGSIAGSVGSSSSALSGLININPMPSLPSLPNISQARSFVSSAVSNVSSYLDVNRTGNGDEDG